jgi:hypothetical protein
MVAWVGAKKLNWPAAFLACTFAYIIPHGVCRFIFPVTIHEDKK